MRLRRPRGTRSPRAGGSAGDVDRQAQIAAQVRSNHRGAVAKGDNGAVAAGPRGVAVKGEDGYAAAGRRGAVVSGDEGYAAVGRHGKS